MAERVDPQALVERLSSEHEAWRIDAEQRLVEQGAESLPWLRRALSAREPAVRLHAARALCKLKDATALPELVGLLAETENSSAVAIAAERALVEWGAPVKHALLDAALRGPAGGRPRALRALGRIGGAELEGPLTALLSDPVPAIRAQAAAALASALGQRAIPIVAPLLSDPDKWVRWEVAEALVGQGSALGRAVLEEARQDPDEAASWVPGWAEDLLERIEDLIRTGRAV